MSIIGVGLCGVMLLAMGDASAQQSHGSIMPSAPPNYYAVLPPNAPIKDLELFAKKDPRIETVARAICRLRGIDPDHVGFPYPDGPVWEYMIPQAMLFLAEHDAATHPPVRKSPP